MGEGAFRRAQKRKSPIPTPFLPNPPKSTQNGHDRSSRKVELLSGKNPYPVADIGAGPHPAPDYALIVDA